MAMQEALRALALRGVHWFDILDILAVAVLFYYVIRQVRGTRAVQMLMGVLVLVVANALSGLLEMTSTHRILQNFLFYIPFAIIVLFQDTIRKALASLGSAFFSRRVARQATQHLARETAVACFALAGQRHGALVIFERTQGLKDYADTGVKIRAELTADLLTTVFFPGTPLHDGAVIVVESQIEAAGCFLPLSTTELPIEFGTRHRAALGLSEETDAICVVVSEERGAVSLAVEGELEQVPTVDELESRLFQLFGGRPRDSKTAATAA
jgi:diadenylate cyclase